MQDDLKKYFSEHAANPNFKSSNVARWYTELSNGQIAALQLVRTLHPETKTSPRWYEFAPEFIIGKNTKVAKEFFNKNWKSKSWNKSTSKAGIEGLNWAKNMLSELISSNSLGDGFIMIYGSNQKRLNAYKKMTRGVTGFYFHEDSNALVKEVKSDDIYTWELNNSKHIRIDEYKRTKHSVMSKDMESEIPSTVAFEFPKTWSDKSSAVALDRSQVKTFALENSKSPVIERSASTLTPNIVENKSVQNTLINNKSTERTIFNTGIKDATMVTRSNASNLIQGTNKINTMTNKILSRVLK